MFGSSGDDALGCGDHPGVHAQQALHHRVAAGLLSDLPGHRVERVFRVFDLAARENPVGLALRWYLWASSTCPSSTHTAYAASRNLIPVPPSSRSRIVSDRRTWAGGACRGVHERNSWQIERCRSAVLPVVPLLSCRIAAQESALGTPCCRLSLAHRAARRRAPRYPSDTTDAQWQVIDPLLPDPAWLAGQGGRLGRSGHTAIGTAKPADADQGKSAHVQLAFRHGPPA
jgi:hypothetical protein